MPKELHLGLYCISNVTKIFGSKITEKLGVNIKH